MADRGDSEVELGQKPDEPPVQAEPPPKPDVLLSVDGFGLMPSSKGLKAMEEQSKGSCASSTNIDVVKRFTWITKNRMTVQLMSYGATFLSIKVPDKKGVPDDVIAGFDSLEEYFSPRNPYFGCVIGRYANYICDGTMCVRPSGRTYLLTLNKGYHHYNGGTIGFDKVNWRSYVSGNKVIMSHVSERFQEGYPGTLMVQAMFEVTCDNTIKIEMKCTTSEPTIVNLSNSQYFNLAGHHSGKQTMYDHIFTINADKYTPMTEDNIVTGEKKVVGGTLLDFRVPRLLRPMIAKIPLGGYDLNYCVTQGVEQDLAFQARVVHPITGRVLEVYSNQPGLQFYTGNRLPDPDKVVEPPTEPAEEQVTKEIKGEGNNRIGEEMTANEFGEEFNKELEVEVEEEEEEQKSEGKQGYGYVPLYGKGRAQYKKHGLFCLLPQNYPDAVNHKNFPNSVLNPGEEYVHRIQYKFGILLGRYV